MVNIIARISPPTGYVRPVNEVHTEFPKWLHFADKPSVLVADAEEESRVLAGGEPDRVPEVVSLAPVATLQGSVDEEALLRKVAEERGIHIDCRWGIKKIRRVIDAASPSPPEAA